MTYTRKHTKSRGSDFPQDHRDLLLKLPSLEECCTPPETEFWTTTLNMALSSRRPREVAEFAATGLDNPLLVRAYPYIREAIRRWALMDDTWISWDSPMFDSVLAVVDAW
jgi:hypothetical protein